MGDAAFNAALVAGVDFAAPQANPLSAPGPQGMTTSSKQNNHLPKCPTLYAWITNADQLALSEPGHETQNTFARPVLSEVGKLQEGASVAAATDPLDSIPTVYPSNGLPGALHDAQSLLQSSAQTLPPQPLNGQVYPPGYVPESPQVAANPKVNPAPYSPPASDPPVAAPQLPALIPLQLAAPLSLDIECHISTAFVTMDASWRLSCVANKKKVDCLFALPVNHQGTVTAVEIDMGGGRMFATLVVPKDEASGYGAAGSKDAIPQDNSKYNPELFRLTIPQVDAGATLRLKVTWFQPMLFSSGKYGVRIPLEIPFWHLPKGIPLKQALVVRCMINTGSNLPVGLGEFSHPMKQTYSAPGQVALVADTAEEWPESDFVASYQVWSQEILTSLIVQYPQKELGKAPVDPRGTFCLSVAPPDPEHVQSFNRAVVFLLDRSGSMDGQPMLDAQLAIIQGLQLLRPEDRFTIVGFDHEQVAFTPFLQQATVEAVTAASKWVRETCYARGLTDILAPLNTAMQLLGTVPDAVPYVFLITDGAVDNEREICKSMQALIAAAGLRAPRISTFGIGTFCNFFFLKMLASIGRGLNDVVFNTDLLKEQMERMLVAASAPVLTNLALQIEGLAEFEAYPFPIPDLFCGNPLVVSGKFAGEFPGALTLYGTLPTGEVYQTRVAAQSAPQIPLSKVFVKQQLDLWTAQAWLNKDERLKQRVVDLSVSTGVPSEHTAMVGFETTPEKLGKLKEDMQSGKKTNLKKFAVTKYAAIAVVGGLAIGFGSVAATMGNIPLGDFGNLGGDIGGLCGDVFCCEFGDICGTCGDCWGSVGGVFTGCFDGSGDTCGACGDCLGGGVEGFVTCVETICVCICGTFGDILSAC